MEFKKKCKRCGEEKPLSNFSKNIRRKDGYADWCKDCTKQYKKENPQLGKTSYENWKEKCEFNPMKANAHKETMKQWRRNNPDKIKLYNQMQKEKRQSNKS